jgi:hypothetical protein
LIIPKKREFFNTFGWIKNAQDLPEDFVCPICGLDKDAFEEQA